MTSTTRTSVEEECELDVVDGGRGWSLARVRGGTLEVDRGRDLAAEDRQQRTSRGPETSTAVRSRAVSGRPRMKPGFARGNQAHGLVVLNVVEGRAPARRGRTGRPLR